MTSRILKLISLLTTWVATSSFWIAVAQEPTATENSELAELLGSARQYEIQTKESDATLQLRESPLLNFTNPERNQERGSVFVWMRDERPAVIGQFFYFNVLGRRETKHALHSLSASPLAAKFHDAVAWTPERPGLEWKPFAEAPTVDGSPAKRRLQMRQLTRRFQVNLIDPKDKSTELRLAPRPLLEYSAPKSGVTDGGIFSYVIATDPEAILLVEAFDAGGKSGFRYAFARFHFYRLIATEGDNIVWNVEYDPDMKGNRLGNPVTLKKVYNSYHP